MKMIRAAAAIAGGFLLCSCALVDQYEDRIYTSNIQSQNAMNQEMLVNIVRASRFHGLNFVALTQVSGSQTETLNTGLPTITLGPAQTIAQHQFQVSNSLSSAANATFQSNPLVSTQFQSAMLSPASARTVALLIASHVREPVLYALLSAITLSDGNFVVQFRNDPLQKPQIADEQGRSNTACQRLPQEEVFDDSDLPAKYSIFTKNELRQISYECNYLAFVHFFRVLHNAGLTAELIPAEAASGKSGSVDKTSKDNTSQKDAPQATGHICFDHAITDPRNDADPACGAALPAGRAGGAKKLSKTPRLTFDGMGTYDLQLTFRSPEAVFRFLGVLYSQKKGGRFRYRSASLQTLVGPGEPFIDITTERRSNCYASVVYDGEHYCVPSSSSNTALMFNILQNLRNLSTQSTDLNSAFTVRLAN